MAKYSIKELENLSGIKAHTIRIWEKRYGVIEPRRTDTNIRYYSDDDLKRLLNISILNRNGMRISEISRLSDTDISEKVMNVSSESGSADSQIEGMIIAMVDLDELTFDRILSRFIMHEGFEKAVTKIIFPFFEKIGILWQTGSINPAQEHFVSNLFRQKLMVAIDNLHLADVQSAKKFVVFLPEGEYHELGLLFFYYLIKKAGNQVYYLGSSVPFPDLIETSKMVKPDYLFTSFTCSIQTKEYQDYIHKLSKSFPFQTILLTGNFASEYVNSMPSNILKIKNPSELSEFLKGIS